MSMPVTFTVTRNPQNAGRKLKATESQRVFESIGTQTHMITTDTETQKDYSPLESILSDLPLLPYNDLLYLNHNLFHNIKDEDKVIYLFSLFENLNSKNQETFFDCLGANFNEDLSQATSSSINKTKDLSVRELPH